MVSIIKKLNDYERKFEEFTEEPVVIFLALLLLVALILKFIFK